MLHPAMFVGIAERNKRNFIVTERKQMLHHVNIPYYSYQSHGQNNLTFIGHSPNNNDLLSRQVSANMDNAAIDKDRSMLKILKLYCNNLQKDSVTFI